MQPAVPDPAPEDDPWMSADEVGSFEQGNEFSRWALARYIVGRVILERVSWSLLAVAGVIIVVAVLCQIALHATALTVIFAIVALMVLMMRAILRAVLHRLMGAKTYGPVEDRLNEIIKGASKDIFGELKRVGLPSSVITLPLIAVRLIGKRRKQTMTRIRSFEVERAVSKGRLDELHLLLRGALGGANRGGGPA